MPLLPSQKKKQEPIIASSQGVKWVQRKIKVSVIANYKEERWEVDAWCSGPVGYHKTLDKNSDGKTYQWIIVSLTTGLAVTMVDREEDARKIAEILLVKCRLALSQFTKEKASGMFPQKIKDWCKACYKERAFVEPTF